MAHKMVSTGARSQGNGDGCRAGVSWAERCIRCGIRHTGFKPYGEPGSENYDPEGVAEKLDVPLWVRGQREGVNYDINVINPLVEQRIAACAAA